MPKPQYYLPDLGRVPKICRPIICVLRNYICFPVFLKIWFFWPKCELVTFSQSSKIMSGFFFLNCWYQHCMSPQLQLMIFSLDIYMNFSILKGFEPKKPISLSKVPVTPDKGRFISLGQWRQGHGKRGFGSYLARNDYYISCLI